MKKNILRIFLVLLAMMIMSSCGNGDAVMTDTKIALSESSISLKPGETGTLSVIGYEGEINWSSSNPSVAEVDMSGVVSAVSIGRAAITAETEKDETVTCIVEVQPGESVIQSISVSSRFSGAADITVDYNSSDTVELKASCFPESNEKLLWTSSDTLLASVSDSGVVTVYGNGTVEIKATAVNGISGKCIVRIKNAPANAVNANIPNTEGDIPVIPEDEDNLSSKFTAPVPISSPSAKTSVIISDKNVYLNVGESFKLTYAVGNTQSSDVKWTSSDMTVAIVKNGRIVAIGEGRATVSAVTGDGAAAKCEVAVGENEIKKMKKEVSDSKR